MATRFKLTSDDATVTGGELLAAVHRYARALSGPGIGRGSLVARLASNHPTALAVRYAANLIGAAATYLSVPASEAARAALLKWIASLRAQRQSSGRSISNRNRSKIRSCQKELVSCETSEKYRDGLTTGILVAANQDLGSMKEIERRLEAAPALSLLCSESARLPSAILRHA